MPKSLSRSSLRALVASRTARFFVLGSAAAAATLLACVGDESTGGVTPLDAGSSDGGSPGTDATPNADGGNGGMDAGTDGSTTQSEGGGGDAGPPPAATGNVLWAKTWLANSADAVVVDAAGNTYVAGTYYGTNVDFDGTALSSMGGMQDIFVAQLDPQGKLLWVKSFGSAGADFVHAIALGANNDLYIAGEINGTGSIDFGTTVTGSGGSQTGFVAKLSTAGVAAWGVAFTSASSNSLQCKSLAVVGTTLGAACNFNGPLFSYTGGSATNHDATANNAGDGVIVGIDISGASPNVTWSNAIGSAGAADRVSTIAPHGTTDFLISGTTTGTGITDNKATITLPHIGAAGANNAFYARIAASTGKADPWTKGYGDAMGDGGVQGSVVAVDPTGTLAYFGGAITTRGDVGTGTIASSGIDDAYCSQVSLTDESTKWLKIAGGSTTTNNLVVESTVSIAVDKWSEVVCVGTTGSADSKVDGVSIQSPQGTSTAAEGIFIGKFSSSANRLWVKGVASQQAGANDNYVGFGGLSTAIAPNGEIRIATSWNGQFSFDGGASITSPGGGFTQAALILALSP
jgi:hypothetical protein